MLFFAGLSAPLPLCSALIWNVSDTETILSVSIGQVSVRLIRTKWLRCPLQSAQRRRAQRQRRRKPSLEVTCCCVTIHTHACSACTGLSIGESMKSNR